MLILTALLVVLFFIMMRRLGGAGSAMAFGRSRGKLYAQEDIGITFNDVAGIDEAVDELREVVEFLKTPEKYQVLGGRIPKGVLLVGPPGTGKTLLAKAIAGEAGVPFFSLSGSDFVEMFVGVGAARVRDMFQQAQAKAPCIVFIDELDALGKTRGTSIVGGHDEREQTLNALLVEMDGFSSNSGVIVMAATNRPETLDPALLRPGRFDRHVLVDRPDVRGREADPRRSTSQKVKLDESVEPEGSRRDHARASSAPTWPTWSTRPPCWPPARARRPSRMDEFNEGVERVTAGLEKRQRIMHDDEKQRVAYHESGPRPGRLQPAEHRSGPQGLDHSPRPGRAGLHDAAARGRPLPDDAERIGKPHPGAAGRHGGRGDDLRRRLDRRPERPGAGHRDRPQHGHGLRHEPPGPGELTARAAARRSWPAATTCRANAATASRPPAKSTRKSRRIIDESLEKVRAHPRNAAQGPGGPGRAADREGSDRHRRTEARSIEANSPSPMIVPGTTAPAKRRHGEEAAESPSEAAAGEAGG